MVHLVRLGDDGWSLWRDAELRGAGFPAHRVLVLADSELAATVDRHLSKSGGVVRHVRKSDGADLQDLERAFEATSAHVNRELRNIASDDAFREAMIWQNRRAVNAGIAWFLRQPPQVRGFKVRQQERLLALYVQRYCTKNDTISFFGPHSAATWGDAAQPVRLQLGARFLASRRTFLEPWAIDALADALSTSPELRRVLCPRRLPSVRIEGTKLLRPGRVDDLPADYAGLIASCDGERTAEQIARDMLADTRFELDGEEDVFGMLEELVEKGLVRWALDIPTTGGRPEDLLRAQLARLPEGAARASATAALRELEQGIERISAAVGDPRGLDAALVELEKTFVTLTGRSSTRSEGATYAGRTIVGEDCVRDVELELGAPLRAELAGPLSLIGQSARWFTYTVATRYRRAFEEIFARESTPAGSMEYIEFQHHIRDLFPQAGGTNAIVADVVSDLHQRWRELLAIRPDERIVERSVEDVRASVLRLFDAPGPGWPQARFVSPDVLIARERNDLEPRLRFVLGEVHVGLNAIIRPVMPHRDPDRLVAQRDADLGIPTIAPVWSHARSRLDIYSRSARDYDVELGIARSSRDRAHVLRAGDLVVEQRDAKLVVRARDGSVSFDIIAFHEQHLIGQSLSEFSLNGEGDHVPRVVIGKLVCARERWRFAAQDLAFAKLDEPLRQYVAARAFAAAHGLPRWVFLKTDREIKPLFLDFDSPLLVDTVARIIRQSSRVTLSEMMPSFDELWFEDATGSRYTSEVRCCMLDPISWDPNL